MTPSDARSRTFYPRNSDAELVTITANACAVGGTFTPSHANAREGHQGAPTAANSGTKPPETDHPDARLQSPPGAAGGAIRTPPAAQ